jgi:hypothetical protein
VKTYIVLYKEGVPNPHNYDAPEGFRCQADDPEHAAEQFQNAYPNAELVLVHEGGDIDEAMEQFYEEAV